MNFEDWWDKNQHKFGMDCYPDDFEEAWKAGQKETAKRCIELALDDKAGHYNYIEHIQKEFLEG